MSERFKIIFNGDFDDAPEVVRLIQREHDCFEMSWLKNGQGWGFALSNGHAYFMRKIAGGISANQFDRPTPPGDQP